MLVSTRRSALSMSRKPGDGVTEGDRVTVAVTDGDTLVEALTEGLAVTLPVTEGVTEAEGDTDGVTVTLAVTLGVVVSEALGVALEEAAAKGSGLSGVIAGEQSEFGEMQHAMRGDRATMRGVS